MAAIAPNGTSGYISTNGSGHKCSLVFVDSVLYYYSNQYIDEFKKANTLTLRCRLFFVPLLCNDNLSEC